MIGVLFIIWSATIYYLYGYISAYFLHGTEVSDNFFIRSVFGMSIIAICVPTAYIIGAPLHQIFFALNTGALIIFLVLISKLKVLKKSVNFVIKRSDFFVLSILAMMVLPGVLGGAQFCFFQGNHYDTYNYMEAAATMARFDISFLSKSTLTQIAQNSGLPFVKEYLTLRPSVGIIYGCFQFFNTKSFLELNYFYLLYPIFLTGGLLGVVVKKIYSTASLLFSYIVGFTFACGFWGQYILDINAWSQIYWTPLEILGIYLWIVIISELSEGAYPCYKLLVINAFVLAAAFYIYPEGFAFLLPPVVIATVYFNNGIHIGKLIYNIFIIICIVLFLVIPVWKCNVNYMFIQLFQVAANPNTWWHYFQATLFGRDGLNDSFIINIIDGLAGVFGLYFITPSASSSVVISLLFRTAILIWVAGLITGIVLYLKSSDVSRLYKFLHIFFLIGFIQCLFLCYKIQYWSAGKGLTYFIPWLVMLITIPIVFINKFKLRYIYPYACLIAFIISQYGFGFARIISVGKSNNGIHFDPPYPSIQDEGQIKQVFDFSDHSFMDIINNKDTVLIDIPNKWLEHYLELIFVSRNINFTSTKPVLVGPTSKQNIGLIVCNSKPTVVVQLIKNISNSGKNTYSIKSRRIDNFN
jgi:hypothetical protein